MHDIGTPVYDMPYIGHVSFGQRVVLHRFWCHLRQLLVFDSFRIRTCVGQMFSQNWHCHCRRPPRAPSFVQSKFWAFVYLLGPHVWDVYKSLRVPQIFCWFFKQKQKEIEIEIEIGEGVQLATIAIDHGGVEGT